MIVSFVLSFISLVMAEQFYQLEVSNIEKTTAECVVITLDVKEELKSIFAFKHGQYLTLQASIDGKDLRRSYSLCSSPSDGVWQVAVKKIGGGVFSSFANDELKMGDVLDVLPPEGNFYVEVDQLNQKNYIGFAAGSGITPILSIIKEHLIQEPKATFKLFYTNQTATTVILKEELEALKNKFLGRFEIFYLLTRQQRSVPLLNGRLDADKLNVIFKSLCRIEDIDDYFSCGPEQMVMMIRDFLIDQGVSKEKIHYELFFTNVDNQKKEILKEKFGKNDCRLSVIEGGQTTEFVIGQGGNNVLDTAMNNGVDLPFACKGGVCCTCRAKLVEGDVEMLVTYGLDEDEIKEGYILTCQAIPISDKVVVDFDA